MIQRDLFAESKTVHRVITTIDVPAGPAMFTSRVCRLGGLVLQGFPVAPVQIVGIERIFMRIKILRQHTVFFHFTEIMLIMNWRSP